MIFFDPTEARAETRLPEQTLAAGQALPGLEEYTGADLLISPLRLPTLTAVTEAIPTQLALRQHAKVGILVQRKTGMDALGSLSNYPYILAKMLGWCETVAPWLLLVGKYTSGRGGRLIVDGRNTDFSYATFQGMLESWQIRSIEGAAFDGGCVTVVETDVQAGAWVARWHDKIGAIQEDEKLILEVKPTQYIVTPADRGKSQPWRATLATLPGIGAELATRIADYCGSLAQSLAFLSDPAHLAWKTTHESYPTGIGSSKFAGVRQWLGLGSAPDGDLEVLAVVYRNQLERESTE